MPYYIQAVHLEPSNAGDHEHIAQVQWLETSRGQTGYSDTAAMVRFIKDGGDVRVSDGSREVAVGVVDATPPYLRTHADGYYSDNLLELPRY